MNNTTGMWKNSFSVGIQEIDEEHKVLIDCLDTIMISLNTTSGQYQAVAALEKLTNYSLTHFRVEECLMRLFDYPELEAHQKEHEQFIKKIEEFRLKAQSEDISKSMAAYLMQWLINHIQRVDIKYVNFFKQSGGPKMTC